MPVSTWVYALSFGRCRMSKFWLLVYFDFLGVFVARCYELRRCWAKNMGIKVIRVDVPQCVKDLLRDEEFGAGTSQLFLGLYIA